jgi:redox-regulated HSP33 family molecular chaperone
MGESDVVRKKYKFEYKINLNCHFCNGFYQFEFLRRKLRHLLENFEIKNEK